MIFEWAIRVQKSCRDKATVEKLFLEPLSAAAHSGIRAMRASKTNDLTDPLELD